MSRQKEIHQYFINQKSSFWNSLHTRFCPVVAISGINSGRKNYVIKRWWSFQQIFVGTSPHFVYSNGTIQKVLSSLRFNQHTFSRAVRWQKYWTLCRRQSQNWYDILHGVPQPWFPQDGNDPSHWNNFISMSSSVEAVGLNSEDLDKWKRKRMKIVMKIVMNSSTTKEIRVLKWGESGRGR